jgi:large subunit ribosomal protein L17
LYPVEVYAAMENKSEFVKEIEETGNYLQISFSRAPKKNQEALAQLGRRWVQWLNKHGVSSRIYYLNNSSTTTSDEKVPEGVESIAKIFSVSNDEMLGVSLQFYRDQAHANEVYSKMMQDETCGAIGKEFDGLVTQGKGMITDGFSRLRLD